MQTWAIIAQKGGAGKTTLALHVGIALSQMLKRVHILDVDPQQSAARWSAQRKGLQPTVTPIVAPQIFDVVEQLRHRDATDIVLVDTSPRADRESLIVAKAADFIIVPARPSALDLPAVEDTLRLLEEAGHIHKAVVVLNAVAASTDEGELAAAYMRRLGPELCPFMLGERVDYRRSLLLGKGVTEAKKSGEAVKEITGLAKWMLKKANATQEAGNVRGKSVRKAG
jgi:chromosome partitioning protein